MRYIPLTQGKQALVDDADYQRVSLRKWSFHHSGYAVGGKPQVSLHRFILGAEKGKQIDHKNGDKLDCRKDNLRYCGAKQNQWNARKGPIGVHFRADRNAWIVRMNFNGRKQFVGYFKSLEDALEKRRLVSLERHGEFSRYA